METPHLNLPYLAAAQAQKHITHNEALRKLDALVQLSITSRALNVPPLIPLEGARFLVADNAQDAWTGQQDKIAAFQDGGWLFYPPLEGWLCWVQDESKLIILSQGAWINAAAPNSDSAPAIQSGTYTPTLGGINTNSYAGATGLNIEYAHYTRIDTLCFVRLSFSVNGLTTADLLSGSTVTLQGLPFAGKNLTAAPVDQFAAGAVFRSIGGAKNTLLGGYCAVNTLYLFTFALTAHNAKNTDKHFVSFNYEIEAP